MIKRIRMKKLIPVLILISVLAFLSFKQKNDSPSSLITPSAAKGLPTAQHYSSPDTLLIPDETHFKNVQQLTFGGDNAEAY
jgi:hypothetical protein